MSDSFGGQVRRAAASPHGGQATRHGRIEDALQGFAVSVEVTARVLGLGLNATYRAVRAGDIPSVRIGGRLLVPTAHLRRMLGLEAT